MSTTPVSDTFTVLESFTGVNDTGKKFLTGVIDTGKACIRRCQWHWRSMYLPLSMTPAKHVTSVIDTGDVMHHRCHWFLTVNIANFAGVIDTGEAFLHRCQWHRQCMHCRCRWHRWCSSRTFGSSPMHLKEQSVKKQAISRYYFSIASNQSSKESSNYNKFVCIVGVIDTGDATEKSNISANIRKKLKSLLGLSTGPGEVVWRKKTRGEKSGGTVALSKSSKSLGVHPWLRTVWRSWFLWKGTWTC